MIIINFFKKYVSHFLAIISNLLVYVFLMMPLIVYTTIDGDVTKNFSLNIFQLLFSNQSHAWVWILFLFLTLNGTILMIIISIFKHFDKIKEVLVSVELLNLCILSCLVFVSKEIFNWTVAEVVENYDSCQIGWGFAVVIVLLGCQILFCISFVSFTKGGLKVLCENAMMVALAFVLSFIKFFSMPTGGSVNLQMLPLMILALRAGPLSGFLFGGFLYGLLTCFTDGYGFQSFPFDYLIGFGSVAIIGLFKPLILGKDIKKSKKDDNTAENEKPKLPNFILGEVFILIGGILVSCVRFIGGVVSTLAFWAPGNLVYALTYNAPYIFVSGALATAGLMLIYPVLRKLR